jgi:DNA-binding NtrC family response regulator
VIAATNKDLRLEIENKNFREDLYHRLSVIIIQVPTLNERIEDIPILVDYFITQICNEYGRSKVGITEQAIKELQKIKWTGNIRELRNVIERLIILCDKTITDKDVAAYAMPISKQDGSGAAST